MNGKFPVKYLLHRELQEPTSTLVTQIVDDGERKFVCA